MQKWLPLLVSLTFGISPWVRGDTLIAPGPESKWHYLEPGKTPTENWREASFDAAEWKTGGAPLGYGEPDLETNIEGGKKNETHQITSWFRRTFDGTSSAGEHGLILMLRVDDGAAVYLNGKEIARENLAAQAGADTKATVEFGRREELQWRRYEVPSAQISKGTNVLAVEVHQFAAASDDLVLDLSLRTLTGNGVGTAHLSGEAKAVSLAYFQNHFIGPELRVVDGYTDGGRRMVIADDGRISSQREILVIDRKQDANLRKHLEHARDPKLQELPALERAKALAQYVDKALSPTAGRSFALDAVERFTAEYANRPVLFGEMAEVCQAGVCRHRALLFKMLADEAGLKAAIVRGNYFDGRAGGGHAWNELFLDDGARLIVDIMNPQPDFDFLPDTDQSIKHYISVRNEPLYPKPSWKTEKQEGKPPAPATQPAAKQKGETDKKAAPGVSALGKPDLVIQH